MREITKTSSLPPKPGEESKPLVKENNDKQVAEPVYHNPDTLIWLIGQSNELPQGGILGGDYNPY